MPRLSPPQHGLRYALAAVAALTTACGAMPSNTAQVEANLALGRRVIEEVWVKKNLAALPDIYAANYVGHTNGVRDTLSVESNIQGTMAQYPDFSVTLDEVFASADRIGMRWTFTATDVATGVTIVVPGSYIGHVDDGKLVEGWNTWDNLGPTLATGATITPAAPKTLSRK
jgi:hypothetical protein